MKSHCLVHSYLQRCVDFALIISSHRFDREAVNVDIEQLVLVPIPPAVTISKALSQTQNRRPQCIVAKRPTSIRLILCFTDTQQKKSTSQSFDLCKELRKMSLQVGQALFHHDTVQKLQLKAVFTRILLDLRVGPGCARYVNAHDQNPVRLVCMSTTPVKIRLAHFCKNSAFFKYCQVQVCEPTCHTGFQSSILVGHVDKPKNLENTNPVRHSISTISMTCCSSSTINFLLCGTSTIHHEQTSGFDQKLPIQMRGGGFLPEIRREKSGHGRVSPSKRKSTSTCIMSLHTLSTIVTVTTHITNVRPRTIPIERAEDKNSVRLAGVSVNDSCQNPSCAFHGSKRPG